MERADIAARLDLIGDLLEIRGENPFKVRAYRTGARALESLEGDLGQLLQTGKLAEVKGIGKALVDKIAAFYTDQPLPYFDDLKSSVPAGLIEMLEVPGLGPKKVRKLHDALQVTSLEGLKAACEAGQVASLEGFGKKSEQKLLSGIQRAPPAVASSRSGRPAGGRAAKVASGRACRSSRQPASEHGNGG